MDAFDVHVAVRHEDQVADAFVGDGQHTLDIVVDRVGHVQDALAAVDFKQGVRLDVFYTLVGVQLVDLDEVEFRPVHPVHAVRARAQLRTLGPYKQSAW